jgi:hypothetical protein
MVPYRVQRVQYCVYDFIAHQWHGSTLAMYELENTNGWKFRGIKMGIEQCTWPSAKIANSVFIVLQWVSSNNIV